MRAPLIAAVSLCALSCTSPAVRGGSTVAAGHEPLGRPLSVYDAVDCHDAAGDPVEYYSRVFVVARARGGRVLVETRAGFDSLVVDNTFRDAGDEVYQAVMRSPHRGPLLHEFRVPAGPGDSGRLLVTPSWKERATHAGGFQANPEHPVISCRLAPAGADAGAPAGTAGARSAGGAAPAVPASLGTVQAQDGYKPGDHVAVDHGAAVARARVVQSVGGRYYVQYDAGGTEWIDKSRIRGKIR